MVDGRGGHAHTTLSQLQHAFVQTQKLDSRFLTEVLHLMSLIMRDH